MPPVAPWLAPGAAALPNGIPRGWEVCEERHRKPASAPSWVAREAGVARRPALSPPAPYPGAQATAKREWRKMQRKQNQVSLGMLDELDEHPELSPAAMAELARKQAEHATKRAAASQAEATPAPAASPAVPASRSTPPSLAASPAVPASRSTPPPLAASPAVPASRSSPPPPAAKPARHAQSPAAAAPEAAAAPDTVLLGRLETQLAAARARKDYLACAELRDQIHPLRVASLAAELAAAAAAQDFMRCVEIKEERDELIRKAEEREAKKKKGGAR
eukprot:scaffold9331_cov116-Isochrysis_galbana.AAC.1